MYHKANGTKGFSFSRFINNATPSMMFDSAKDPGHISMLQKDMFYSHQLQLSYPYGLSPTSLQASGILDTEGISSKTYKKLQQSGVVFETDGTVDTNKIDKNFTHNLAAISVVRQKQIVDLLFWWEEECMRLRKLYGEREELEDLVTGASGQSLEMYRQLLERVKGKIAAKPTERIEELEKDQDECIVRYRAGGSAPLQNQQGSDEVLPAYSGY